MKIKVCQFVYGDLAKPDSWFSKFVEPINRMYCETHGHDYVVDRLDTIRPDRGGHWEKVPHILGNLFACDYLFYLDADAVFYNHLFAIEEELLHRWEPHHLMMFSTDCAEECNRWHPYNINSGVGLFRNMQETRDIIAEWDTVTDMPEHEGTRWSYPSDQAGFNNYILPKYQDRVKLLKNYYLMNGFYGTFVRHIFSAFGKDRYKAFEQIYNSPMMARNRKLAGVVIETICCL